MKELLANTAEMMTSLELAKITGKQHSHILRDIRELNKSYGKLNESKIGFIQRITDLGYGRSRKDDYCHLTKLQTWDLLTGYSAELRIRVNRRWAELEEKTILKIPAPKEYNGIRCINYTSWLLQHGYSLMSSRVGARIRKYPDQFRKGKDGWYMSEAIANYFLAYRNLQAPKLESVHPNQLKLFV